MHQKYLVFGAATLVAVAIACGDKQPSPASPSGVAAALSDANADGSTLKATAPVPQSPTGGARVDTRRPTLVIANATGRFTGVGFAYRFQLFQAGNLVSDSGTLGQGANTTSWQVPADLEIDKEYTWRARAELETAFGPWSATASFLTPELREGYIRGNEVYDPLINGKTVGVPIGSVTYIPGVGVQLNDFTSHIRYELPQTLEAGEFSMLITNMPANTEGDKTKVFAMSQGLSDLITNDRRFTVEKRGDPPGIIAWRFITRETQIDTEGPERVAYNFQGNLTYFWKATWGGRFNLRIVEGGVNGRVVYNLGKSYLGVYNPNPHMAFIGAPTGRSGPTAATVPGMVVRQVWISSAPRPDIANQ